MAELSTMRKGPLDHDAQATPACAAAELSLLPPAARFILRCRVGAIVEIGQAFGVALPQAACRAATAGTRAALWLGPDEWFLLAALDEAAAIEQQFADTLAHLPHALVDISHRTVAIAVTGPLAATLLNHGCPLDLSDAAFPAGMCTRTLFAKSEIVLWRTGDDTYRIETERSYATYVWRMLREARTEFEQPVPQA